MRYLGRDLPEEFDALDKVKWFGLFAMHTSRLLVATYWGGVRGFWGLACELTDDTETTLRDEYAVIRDAFKAARELWEEPRAFDEWCDRLLGVTSQGAFGKCERFDALDDMPAALIPAPMAKLLAAWKRKPTKKQLRKTAPRIRRARPDLRGVRPGMPALASTG